MIRLILRVRKAMSYARSKIGQICNIRKHCMVDTGYRIRLRVRLGKAFTCDDLVITAVFDGVTVEIKSQKKDQLLKDTQWIILVARDFASEAEAEVFGNKLRQAVEIAGLAARIGADVGSDTPSGWVSEEWARSQGMLKENERLFPNMHGLTVMPDDELNRFPIIEASGTVTADPQQFVSAIQEIGQGQAILDVAHSGLRLLNMALMAQDHLSQIVLSISAVESLGQLENWTDRQRVMLTQAAQAIAAQYPDDIEGQEVSTAILRGSHRIGLRQGVVRVLARLNLLHLKKEWDNIYSMRSSVFHGTKQVSDREIADLALRSTSLCGAIILRLLAQDGFQETSISRVHFGQYLTNPTNGSAVSKNS